jgi:hypothetical protein
MRCRVPVQYDRLNEHREGRCMYKLTKCLKGCGEILEEKDRFTHEEEACPRRCVS